MDGSLSQGSTALHLRTAANGGVAVQDQSPSQWMYTNLITENCELLVPLPDSEPMAALRLSMGRVNGLKMRWSQLRLGYFWGGDNEVTSRINANDFSASGHIAGADHGQVMTGALNRLPERLALSTVR